MEHRLPGHFRHLKKSNNDDEKKACFPIWGETIRRNKQQPGNNRPYLCPGVLVMAGRTTELKLITGADRKYDDVVKGEETLFYQWPKPKYKRIRARAEMHLRLGVPVRVLFGISDAAGGIWEDYDAGLYVVDSTNRQGVNLTREVEAAEAEEAYFDAECLSDHVLVQALDDFETKRKRRRDGRREPRLPPPCTTPPMPSFSCIAAGAL